MSNLSPLLIGAYMRPQLNQDPTVVAIPGGATATLIKVTSPIAGTLTAVISSDAPLASMLVSPAGSEGLTGRAVVLTAPVLAGQTVTLTAAANSGPCFVVSAALTVTPSLGLNIADLAGIFTLAGQLLLGTGPGTAELLNAPLSTGALLVTDNGDPPLPSWLPAATQQGLVLTSGPGLTFAPEWAAGGGGGVDVQIFTSSGTWEKPAAGNIVQIFALGGGGGGAGASGAALGGGGGGGGAAVTAMIPFAAAPPSQAVTVGAGGLGGPWNTLGGTGNDSTFGALVAQGGNGGTTVAGGNGGGGLRQTGEQTYGQGGAGGAPGSPGVNGSPGTAGSGGGGGGGGNSTTGGVGGGGASGNGGFQASNLSPAGSGSSFSTTAGGGGGGGGGTTKPIPGNGALGGGGGGAGGSTVQAGGNGGNGVVVVITY